MSILNSTTPTANFGNAASGGLYGAGRFGYSINQFSSSLVAATITSASYVDVDFDTNFSGFESKSSKRNSNK